jgi:hypothetical protein
MTFLFFECQKESFLSWYRFVGDARRMLELAKMLAVKQ